MKRILCFPLLLVVLLAVPLVSHADALGATDLVQETQPQAGATEAVSQEAEPQAEPTDAPSQEAQPQAESSDTLDRVLGTLAVYAAIIAAIAAATEVITDLLRPFLGLKRSPQAMESLKQMKDWLPATLKELGADPQAEAQLQGYLDQLDGIVSDVQGLADPQAIAEMVQRWALTAVKSVGASAGKLFAAKLGELQDELLKLGLPTTDIQKVLDSAQMIYDELQGGQQLQPMLQSFRNLLANVAGVTPQQIDTMVTAILSGDQAAVAGLKAQLVNLGLPQATVDAAVELAGDIVSAVRVAQDVIKLAGNLDSYGVLLGTVEEERDEVIGFFRAVWRALRDWNGLGLTRLLFRNMPKTAQWDWIREHSLIGVVLYGLETGWNWLWGKGGAPELKVLLTPETAAEVIKKLDRKHHLTEARRQRALRFTSVFIGIALTIFLRIDSLELLQPIFEGRMPDVLYCDESAKFYTLMQIQGNLFHRDERREGEDWSCKEVPEWAGPDQKVLAIFDWKPWDIENWKGLGKMLFFWIASATPGMFLSGLAASAGSKFWHDQLDRLRVTKEVADQTRAMIGKLRDFPEEGP